MAQTTKRRSKRPSTWVDFGAVRAGVSIEQVLDHYQVLGLFEPTENGLRGPSPLADSKSMPFHVNTHQNVWYCHATKRGGNQLDLVAALEQVSVKEAALLLIEWFELENVQTEAPGRKPGWNVPRGSSQSDDLEVPKGAAPSQELPPEESSSEPNDPLSFELKGIDPHHEALAAYTVSADTLEHFGVGFYTGRGLLSGRLVFPIHNEAGQLVAYGGISLADDEYLYPKQFRPELEVYNLAAWNVHASEQARIVRFPHHVWELHDRGIAAVATMVDGPTLEQEVLLSS